MLEMHLHQESKKKSGGASYFIEELTNSQFISYSNLSTLCGMTQGTLHNEGAGWLRFNYEGTELIVSKKTVRHSIAWDHIHSKGCVFGTAVIRIQGIQYKVRLLTGADTNPTQLASASGYFIEGSHNSEWSRLFYPLVTDDDTLNSQYTGPKDPRYTLSQLQMNSGPHSWCQETYRDNATWRVIRGYSGVSHLAINPSSGVGSVIGWRPCLERI